MNQEEIDRNTREKERQEKMKTDIKQILAERAKQSK
jgi:hypothetical protein